MSETIGIGMATAPASSRLSKLRRFKASLGGKSLPANGRSVTPTAIVI
jgi:hypothetical protein